MKSIKVTVLGKQYPLKVNEGDEAHMHQIASFVDRRLKDFKVALANQSESTIMTLAALSIAEDLFLEKDKKNGDADNSMEVMSVINLSLEELLADIKRNNDDLNEAKKNL
ncbi:MAG: cell division protein ZapA [Balneolales bacterium]